MLKIVSGKYGSRAIQAPKGRETRPTTNRVREAVFSALCSNYSSDMSLLGARVLDPFSGSGALCFEALSRGAEFVLACEKNRSAYQTIKSNSIALKVDVESFYCLCMDSLSQNFLKIIQGFEPFDIILCDPPYSFDSSLTLNLINSLISQGSIKSGALLYYEHAGDARVEIGECCYESKFGDIKCEIYRISE